MIIKCIIKRFIFFSIFLYLNRMYNVVMILSEKLDQLIETLTTIELLELVAKSSILQNEINELNQQLETMEREFKIKNDLACKKLNERIDAIIQKEKEDDKK